MKRLILLLTLFCLALLPTASFANLLLQLPPIFAGASFSKDVCAQYSCYPCYPSCTENPCQPCVDCDASKKCDPCTLENCDGKPCHDCEDPKVCADVEGCPEGPCYPACTEDPCKPCVDCDASTSCNPCKPETCENNKPCDPCVQCDSKCDPCQPETCKNNWPCKGCIPTSVTGVLNDTGITWGANYPDGNNTTCTGEFIAAQDCSHGRDTAPTPNGHAGFTFTKIPEGNCVIDEVTGFVWSPNRGTTTWDNRNSKVTEANNSDLCGINNWRIPTVKELVGIVSYNSTNPAIDGTYFPSSSTTYWTNIPDISNASNAWAVDFNLGRTTRPSKTSNTFEVRLVSGEIKTNNFETVSDGILDRSTGLVWKKCLEGLDGDTCATNTASTFTWQDALNRAIAAGGAWRLPNIKELQTLVNESTVNPATYKDVFPGVPVSAEVWSSSPYADSVTAGGVTYWKSWSVNASGMVTTPLNRASDTLHVRLVRDCTGSECD